MSRDTRITRQQVIDENLVDRYLMGQMSEAEAMAFEDFYAGSPETMQELEESAMLIDGMTHLGRDDGVATPIAAAKKKTGSRFLAVMGTPAYGMAASVVALVAVMIAGANNLRDGAASGDDSLVNIPVVTLSATRGGDAGVEITAGEAPQIVLALDLGIARADSYSASLQSADGSASWHGAGLRPDLLDSLTMSIPRDALPNGDYTMIVRPEADNGDALIFPFTIR